MWGGTHTLRPQHWAIEERPVWRGHSSAQGSHGPEQFMWFWTSVFKTHKCFLDHTDAADTQQAGEQTRQEGLVTLKVSSSLSHAPALTASLSLDFLTSSLLLFIEDLPWFPACVLSHSVISDPFITPWNIAHARLLCPWNFSGKNTGVGCHFLLQGIFSIQRSNLHLLHCRQTVYHWASREAPGF